MWKTSQGILISKTQYSDNQYIVKILSQDEGVNSYSLKIAIKGKNNSARAILGQPLSFVEFVFFDKNSNNIKSIRSINTHTPFSNIPYHFVKQSILLFVNELLIKCLKLPFEDTELFRFLKNILLNLDSTEISVANFPLWFVVRFAKQLGIGPMLPQNSNQKFFELTTGMFKAESKLPQVLLSEHLSAKLLQFLNLETYAHVEMTKQERVVLMNFMLDFVSFHADINTQLQSVPILHAVFKSN